MLVLLFFCWDMGKNLGAIVLILFDLYDYPIKSSFPANYLTTLLSISDTSTICFFWFCSANLRTRLYCTPYRSCIRLILSLSLSYFISFIYSQNGFTTLFDREVNLSLFFVKLCTLTFFWYKDDALRDYNSNVFKVFANFI